MQALCISIKSKKNPTIRCPNHATQGDFCSRHIRTRIQWVPLVINPPLTRSQKSAGTTVLRFFKKKVKPLLRRKRGPAVFTPEISHNERDVFTFDPVSTIPLTYHFSYIDTKSHVWTFDIRFLMQSMQNGDPLKNPYSQEAFPVPAIQRLHTLTQKLGVHKIPLMYTDSSVLTPEQIWNQKVLDVFLQFGALGYGVNIGWFETLDEIGHYVFYRTLYRLWNYTITLDDAAREVLVPGYRSGRNPLFRWHPIALREEKREIKWWRKLTLGLMNTFISRSSDRDTQSCGALYILKAFAYSHRSVAEAYPWLLDE